MAEKWAVKIRNACFGLHFLPPIFLPDSRPHRRRGRWGRGLPRMAQITRIREEVPMVPLTAIPAAPALKSEILKFAICRLPPPRELFTSVRHNPRNQPEIHVSTIRMGHGKHGRKPSVLPYFFCSPTLKSEILKSEIRCRPSRGSQPSPLSHSTVRRNRANETDSQFNPSLRWQSGQNSEPVAEVLGRTSCFYWSFCRSLRTRGSNRQSQFFRLPLATHSRLFRSHVRSPTCDAVTSQNGTTGVPEPAVLNYCHSSNRNRAMDVSQL